MNKRAPIDELMREIADENVVPLRPIIPQPGEKRSPPGDWLSELELETTFLCNSTTRWTPEVKEYTIKGKGPQRGDVLLRENKISGGVDTSNWTWVSPIAFCLDNELREILDE